MTKESATGEPSLTYSALTTNKITDQMLSISSRPSIKLGDQHVPVVLDNGLGLWDSFGVRSLYGSLWHVVGAGKSRRIPGLSEVLTIVSLAVAPRARSISVAGNEVAYVKAGTAFRGRLVPTRKISLIVKGDGGFKQAVVVMG